MKRKRLRIVIIIFSYLLAANFTLLDRVEWFNQFDWGLNYDYWANNTEFIRSLTIWLNLFLLSLAPVFISRYFSFSKFETWVSLALPVHWFYLLFLQVFNQWDSGPVVWQGTSQFVFSFVVLATLVMAIQIILLVRSIRKENKLESLEKFKEKALRKLSILNPDLNQKLLHNLLGEHGEAFNLILAANLEEDEEKKQRLIRLALNEITNARSSIKDLEKRLQRISSITPPDEKGE